MTSFIIKAHESRPENTLWSHDPKCAFCRIIAGELPATKLYENDKVIAILDIMPLRRGHTLVIPKSHIPRLSDLPSEIASALGAAVSKIAHALTQVLNNTALNVVCNQEYAQVVHHVHYHIIPAPNYGLRSHKDGDNNDNAPLSHRQMLNKEFEARQEIEEEDAKMILKHIRTKL